MKNAKSNSPNFLLNPLSETSDTLKFDFLLELREFLAEKPTTMITFTLSEVNDDISLSHRRTLPEVLEYAGCWKAPDRLVVSTDAIRWVNPNAIQSTDLRKYGDIAITCDCGQEIGLQYDCDTPSKFQSRHDQESCNLSKSARAYADLVEKRWQWIQRGLYYNLPMDVVAARITLTANSLRTMVGKQFNTTCTEIREEGREYDVYLADQLQDLGYTQKDIAAGLDVGARTISRWRSKLTA